MHVLWLVMKQWKGELKSVVRDVERVVRRVREIDAKQINAQIA